MKDILLGIDIGTSACKIVAFETDGTVVTQVTMDYPVYYPKQGWAEQDPNQWWEAICKGLKEVTKIVDSKAIKGIGIDGQSWSAIAIDKDGKVLCNTPIWMDTRSSEICQELKETIGEDVLFAKSGNPLQPMYTQPKVHWYKKHMPEVYNNTYKILQSNSFIAYRLTDAVSQDPSQGYGWNCYDMEKGVWDTELCEKMGINSSLLPNIVPCHQVVGTVTETSAKETGLEVGTPVVAGGLDAACGTLGAGVIHSGETQEQGGQAGGMSICMQECKADKALILGAHVVPDLWLLQGGTVGGGGVINWFEREFGHAERETAKATGRSSFAEMDMIAKEIPAGSQGLVFLPYMAGERSPIWDANAKGVFYGIDFSKGRAHFMRAAMEGVAFSLRHNLEVANDAGAPVGVLSSMGGAANSKLWTQIKADITGKKIIVPSSDTATALGAAILAGVGTGIYNNFEEAVEKTVVIKKSYTPNPDNAEIYNQAYETYISLYKNLKPIMNK
ncbi:MAG: xylulokinase [Clostridia bacterium]